MILAKVVGSVVATRKDERLVSNKLLLVRPVDPSSGKLDGGYLVAVDTVDAGAAETVLIVSGSSARMASGLKDCPVDAAIVGIIDTVTVNPE
jgi:microcompartment protein CcmK/EutM